ncbi:MAG: hypothetical protein GAK45_02411 [Pseudomonas citronellolis]|nr:MAG: hypothetical protein GAK45_02411 [Pseudomonas citronellolis]
MLGQARHLLAHAEIAESCLVELFCGATSSLFSTFIILLAIQQAGLSQDRAVSLVMVQGVVLVLGLFSLGAHVQRSGLRGTYLQGLGLAVFGLALVGSGHSYLAYALGGASLSLAMALLHLLNMGQLAAQAQDKSRISGLFNLAGLLGSCSGALLGGAVAQWIGLGNLFLAWIPLLLLAALGCRLRRGASDPLPEG